MIYMISFLMLEEFHLINSFTLYQASVLVIPAEATLIGERRAVPWWVIVLPIAAAFIIITVITVILWSVCTIS